MTLRFLPSLAAALGLAFAAAPARAERGPLDEALQALDEGVAEVAVVKLRQQLGRPLDASLRREVKTKLAEALLAAGRTEEARTLAADPEVNAPVLEARILAAAGRWEEALALYEPAAADPKEPQATAALLGKAECLHALGRLNEAAQALEPAVAGGPASVALRLAEYRLEQKQTDAASRLLAGIRKPPGEAEEKWKRYLEARLHLERNEMAQAFDQFEALRSDPRHLTQPMLVGIALGMAKSRSELTSLTAADDILEQFLWHNPGSPSLALLFQELDAIYAGEENPSLAELQGMAKRTDTPLRTGYAVYYLAKANARDGKPERAQEALGHFATRFPGHPILARALLMQGQLLAASGKAEPAQKALEEASRAAATPELRGEIALASASAHFRAGDFVLAAAIYRGAGEQIPALAETAQFNIALCWLRQGNYARFAQEYADFSGRFRESPLRADLALEEGLQRARAGDAKAEAVLGRFLADFPGAPRAAEARLALAELRYAGGDLPAAGQFLRVVNEAPAPVKTAEQADFLALFVADAATPPNDEKVIALGLAFLERHPASSRVPEVRMKLGQVAFRAGDFAGAQTQFETIARETPTSPLVEQALYLAAESSTKRIGAGNIDHAVELFNDVAARNGPMRQYARLRLAELQNRLGKEADAVTLYNDILRANPSGEIKSAAMLGKADNLLALGAKDKASTAQALEVYQQLAAEPGLSPAFLHRALYQQGRCLELLDRPEEALAAYYQVVQSGSVDPKEYFWFYKAGFDACRLSEAREQWKSAIAIYQKMAAIEGPRAEEAKKQLTRLRLEHFIWDK